MKLSVEKSGVQKKAKQEIFLLSGCQLINNLKFLKACKNIKISSEFQALFIIITNKNSLCRQKIFKFVFFTLN